jgi:hypothetical protein
MERPDTRSEFVIQETEWVKLAIEQAAPLEQVLQRTRGIAQAVGDTDYVRWLGYELAGYPVGEIESGVVEILANIRVIAENRRSVFRGESLVTICAGLGKATQASQYNERMMRGVTGRRHYPGTQLDKETVARKEKSAADLYVFETQRLQLVQTIYHEIQRYVTDIFLRHAYNDTAFQLYERHGAAVERLLKEYDFELFERLPRMFESLKNADPDSIAGSLNTVRRILTALTDKLFPATKESAVDDAGETHKLTSDQVLNRLQEWLKGQNLGEKRYNRLVSTLRGLWPYMSKGVHGDVSVHEAQSITLQTVMIVGELLEIDSLTTK